jgi:hypothetical protein
VVRSVCSVGFVPSADTRNESTIALEPGLVLTNIELVVLLLILRRRQPLRTPMPVDRNSLLKRLVAAFLILFPILLLAWDFMRVPVLFTGCSGKNPDVTTQTLVGEQSAVYGHYMGHSFHVSMDSVQDSTYLSFLEAGPTAMVIAIDHEDPDNPIWGGFFRTVLRKLEILSPADATTLRDVSTGTQPQSMHLLPLPMHIPAAMFGQFPVNRLYVVGIKSHGTQDNDGRKQQLDILENDLKAVMSQARNDGISNLIVPCIGVDPGDSATPEFKEFFPLVFAASDPVRGPQNIYISLYRDWNDPARRGARVALRSAWTDACSASARGSVFVREELRLVLAAIFICLLVSSLHVEINLKNFLIIACSFAGLGYASLSLAQYFIGDWSATYRLAAHVVVLGALALLFPVLPRFNPGEIFGRSANNNG